MVMHRELDLLPEEERVAILSLPADFVVPSDLAVQTSGKSWADLNTSEFLAVLKRKVEPQTSVTTVDPNSSAEPLTASVPSEKIAPPLSKALLIRHRTERIDSLWPTVNWTIYLPALFVGMVGVVLLHRTRQVAVDSETIRTSGLDPVRQALDRLLSEVGRLKQELPAMTPEAVVAFIDERCSEHCNHFADQRELLKTAFGLVGFGEIMSEFASGERFLNRTWSAAADGYMEEADRSIQTSFAFFQAAQTHLNPRP
jgi:hypothetical protein